ncbi:hypothetical protein EJ05DRAFT_502515 [Pseudovirgaria hyperparasitica]|uniref:Rhodopsin domain-containing protein n=1 Tax=Pseudovirgaria hyperparasitica TaxID=470096 RepID=A0A6A6VZF5_9PEZI|nr:uncharacterized protein EJ05DRAFT_502515 [Pseudovirgaria hyperparasitica]KAF2756048.1 hypothetical protein EJ05DRAFT_502515 [Pseudovirgaria hyperparasitica]
MVATLTPDQLATMNDNRNTLIVAVSVVLIVLTTIAIVLRFIARRSRSLHIGVDDWFALVAWVIAIPMCSLNITMIKWGLGRHVWGADVQVLWKVVQTTWAFTLLYAWVHFFIKFSILFFYHRVFSFRIAWFKLACYACGVYAVSWTLAAFFAAGFQCSPVSFLWTSVQLNPPANGKCHLQNGRAALAFAALNSLLDILIFILPMAMLWNLHMKRARKLSLIAVFATGAFAITAGLLRLSNSYLSIDPNADVTWVLADINLWTIAEACVGIICASMPVIGPLFGLVKDNVRSYLSKQSLESGTHGIPLSGRSGESGSTTRLASSRGSHNDSIYALKP